MSTVEQDMKLGAWISGLGHGGLLIWLLLSGIFFTQTDLPEISVTDVSIVSAEEFAALQAPSETVEQDRQSQPVAIEEATPLPVPEPEPEPEIVEQTAPLSLDSPQQAEAAELDPEAETIPEEAARIAPEAVDTPEPEAAIDVVDQAPTAPTAEPVNPVEEAQEETAREAAAEEIITEAEQPSAAAPRQSERPARRPRRAPPTQVAEEQEPPQVPGLQDAINSAVADATRDNANPGAGSGPPITQGEKASFILEIRKCWNVGALSSESLRVTVVIGIALNPDGRPDTGSIRMLSSEGGSNAAVKQAFEAGRRAIIRCGAKGFNLPKEKYAQWKEVQVTFNPEKMRVR